MLWRALSLCDFSKSSEQPFYSDYIAILKRKLNHRCLSKVSPLVGESPAQHHYAFAVGQIFGGRMENGLEEDATGGRETVTGLLLRDRASTKVNGRLGLDLSDI